MGVGSTHYNEKNRRRQAQQALKGRQDCATTNIRNDHFNRRGYIYFYLLLELYVGLLCRQSLIVFTIIVIAITTSLV
jgi:hypothetical protein